MNKKEFLSFLEDEEIKQRIKELILCKTSNNELDNSTKKEEELMSIISDLKEKYKRIKECLTKEEEKNNILKENNNKQNEKITTIDNTMQELQEELNIYKNNFEDEMKIFDKYVALSDSTKLSLSGVFKDDSLVGFISCGVQEKNIQNIWEYIKNEMLENKNEDVETLIEIFYFFFNRYKIAYDMYKLLDTKQSDSFDTQLHIKHNNSTQSSGNISKVYLQGYKNTKTNKVIKQSLVKVG